MNIPSPRKKLLYLALMCLASLYSIRSSAQTCPRPAAGSVVPEPADLRSTNGTLKVELHFRSETLPDGKTRYCYIYEGTSQSPTLRLQPGDDLDLTLFNESRPPATTSGVSGNPHASHSSHSSLAPCTSDISMTAFSTNLHFHGMAVPPTCHQDETLRTFVQPGSQPFEYKIHIPSDAPPGLYWYHPHVHGYSKTQVLGGASGAIIIEGLERSVKKVAGLRERVFVVRDQDLLNPNAAPTDAGSVVPKPRIDKDGDAVNLGTGTGTPAKDLTINFVPVPFPDYPTAVIWMKPNERQVWRTLNACAITYLNFQVLFNGKAQMLEIVALDGVPVNTNGKPEQPVLRNHLGLPPGGRVEFIVLAPPEGTSALFVSRTVNTGPGGENDPNRPLAAIRTSADAPEPVSVLAASPEPLPAHSLPWLGDVPAVRTRKLYFSEKLENPSDPNSPTTFYMTVDGETPAPFDPNSDVPSIVVKQGDVEDWIIENRSNELHAFHIHQIHFLMLQWNGITVNEPFLRDTVDVPYYDGKKPLYPNVTLRMDFRDPKIVGTFVYHCHLLEHEDNGMMGLIRVDPADPVSSVKR